MSKIKEFENIPDIDIEGEETLEEAVADSKALFGKYNKELFNGEVSLERCSEARLVLLTLAHRSHHNMEYSTACLKAELLRLLEWNAWKPEKPRRLFDSHCLRRERVQPESRKEHR